MSNIMSNSSPGLIAAYQCDAAHVVKGTLINLAQPSSANGFNPGNVNLTGKSVILSDKLGFNLKAGIPKNAYSVAGNSSHLITGSVSFLAYVKPTVSNGSGAISLLGKSIDGNNLIGLWYGNNTNLGIKVASSGNVAQLFTGNLNLNVWYSIIGIWDSVNKKVIVYLNGSKVGEIANALLPSNLNNNASLILGAYGLSVNPYFLGYIKDVRMLNRVVTPEEARDYHNYFASKIVLKETFQYPVGATRFGNWSTSPTGSSCNIKEYKSNDQYLEHIRKGTKYYGIDVAGQSSVLRLPSIAAYGKWRWTFRNNGSNITFGFISNSKLNNLTGGLGIQLLSNTIAMLQSGVGFPWQTASNYLITGETYEFEVTRNTSGTIRVYIRGGKFGKNFKEINITGGSGIYPYTNTAIIKSTWFNVTSFNNGNHFTNLIIKQGITI